ncbi:hypothetical protein IW140_000562 [Coemansia sp. RSA 1813]|nr:hypothetical protein EV178_002708 [Coemansia sp. RSA 1646]KAJ1774030.1 hypothetical protein LPJ74_000129 [Coemansia sp. RSA 1843]KAJ2092580.1 hypothetical protein IW138_001018 [Coemansia sp. RSA 986]KAJ2216726.1 hypothetical protein EV179_001016 [Coemansia sp. RSA 487]KAJ2572799.1 hypothetical protein IW140_000562 [Coemansia sp. RSA 1813]
MLKVGGRRLQIHRRSKPARSSVHFILARNKNTAAARIAPVEDHSASAAVDAQAREEICSGISALKVVELNDLMRSCGLTQGTVKAGKISSLGTFIWDAQKLALSRYQNKSKNKRLPRSPAEIHAYFVPDEVVSIDIGYKNLAFAHVSRTGEVLGWRRTELLKEATFEPWTLARVVEEYVQNALPMIPASKCTYLIEHQRFRSQGSAAVTNSIMVNNLVEALLYANLRHISAHIQTVSPALVSTEWEPQTSEKEPNSTISNCVELKPKSTNKKPKDSRKEKKTRRCGGSEKKSQKEKLVSTIAQMDRVLCEQKQLTRTRHELLLSALGRSSPRARALVKTAVRDFDELMLRGTGSLGTLRDLRRRLIKKERTIAVVQAWIIASLASKSILSTSSNDHLDANEAINSTWPFVSGKHIEFAPTAAEMFCDEKKKDDLCDCLTQAVAWYRWQQNTISVLDQYGSALITRYR